MTVKQQSVVGEKTIKKTGPPIAVPPTVWTPSLMGKKGGAKGGYATARKLTKRQRKSRAKHAIQARWKNKKTAGA